MISIARAVRDLIPAEWTRIGLVNAQGLPTVGYGEHPEFLPFFIKTADEFLTSTHPVFQLYWRYFKEGRIGACFELHDSGYLESHYYLEFERRLDSCWTLDAALVADDRTIGAIVLTRPRSMQKFTTDDAEILGRLRPWIAHALRDRDSGGDESDGSSTGKELFAPHHLRRGHLLMDRRGGVIGQGPGVEQLLYLLDGTADNWFTRSRQRKPIPSIIKKLVHGLVAAADGNNAVPPPRMKVVTPWGCVTAEAEWLAPAAVDPLDTAQDPGGTPILVTLSLLEHASSYAARALRELGASPAQVRVGVMLARGFSKPRIARELEVKLSSVEDATRKLYTRLHVHNAAELGTRLWLGDGDEN